jgi:tetratricopeptide (TPR) repeat protein
MQIWSAEIKELEVLYASLKGRFPELEKDIEHLIKTDDENVALLYSRRCLEIIITDLCEIELKRPRKTEPLKGIIDKLHREEKVPSHIITSMDHLNSLSTYGTHPKEFDPEQVKPVLFNLTTILKWYLKYKDTQIISKQKAEEVKDENKPPDVSKETIRKPIRNLILLLFGLLLIAVIIAYPKIFKRNNLESLKSSDGRISIAVMPFQNMTNDTTWNIWQDGIQFNLITSLSNYSDELKVSQTESINNLIQSKSLTNYASITPSFASTISQKLDANVFIYGNINKEGTIIRLNAQLYDTKTEEVFKSFQIEGNSEKIMPVIDTLSAMIKDFLIISKLKKEVSADIQPFAFKSTNSPDAYRYFILGNNAFDKSDMPTAVKYLLQAIAIDSNFNIAALRLSSAYYNQKLYEEGKKWCLRVYEKKDQMPMQLRLWTNRTYSMFYETPYEEIKYLRQLQEIDDQLPVIYYSIGLAYLWKLDQYDKAIPELEKALEIYEKWDSKPSWVLNYVVLGNAYHKADQFKKEKKLYKKAEQDFPNNSYLKYNQSILALSEDDTVAANRYVEEFTSVCKEYSLSEVEIINFLGDIYSEAGIFNKAEEYYRQALSLTPENPINMNYLAYFLIDKDRDINEGLKLVEKALGLNPDNYEYLDTKGWGLYKQGKYKESLEILQKSWDLRRQYAIYDHEAYLHLEEAKKAFASQKNN